MKKTIILLLIFFEIGCSTHRLNGVKKILENTNWQITYHVANSSTMNQSYCTFNDFTFDKDKLVCIQEYNNNKHDFLVLYFQYLNGKLLMCSGVTFYCNEIRIKKDSIENHFTDENGKKVYYVYRKLY
jgi:hypothetical protein